jgi:short-subunit dehydrogenase
MKHLNHIKSSGWALVTGSTMGIGFSYAESLARQNKSLVLVARNEAKLTEVAQDLAQRYDISTKIIATDLSTQAGLDKVISETRGIFVDLLINNAGKEESGNFADNHVDEMLNSIALNCSAPLVLSHHFSALMGENGGGSILFLSSIVAFQGVPLIANYAATKSYLLVLAEGLAPELKQKGIHISVAAPGFTRSNLSPQINFNGTPFKPLDADFVAQYTLDRLGRQLLIVPGFINKFLFFAGKYIQPRRMSSFAFGQVFKMVLKDKMATQKMAGVKT